MNIDTGVRNLAVLVAIGMLAGLAAIFFWVPTDDFQGVAQRLFYIHVPSAWVAYLAFAVVLVGSIAHLKTGSRRWDLLADSSAEVGVVFTGITLVTGMMWGRPVWGAYWQWEPRLTSTFVLFVVYLGYVVFRRMGDPGRTGRIAAVIGIVGFVNVPLVHFSVRWWRGLHPSGVVNPASEANLPWQMLVTMLFMLGVFTLLYALFLTLRVRLGRLEDRLLLLEGR
ncbi:MAG: cytochrome c biogenesis protein CcsA [Actinobacteria bacterium]|nr:cytochrome c biogenesis protein CcsA [Actinomycetota bacterium]